MSRSDSCQTSRVSMCSCAICCKPTALKCARILNEIPYTSSLLFWVAAPVGLNLGKKISVPKDIMMEELNLSSNRGSRMFQERQKRAERFTLENSVNGIDNTSSVRNREAKRMHSVRFKMTGSSRSHNDFLWWSDWNKSPVTVKVIVGHCKVLGSLLAVRVFSRGIKTGRLGWLEILQRLWMWLGVEMCGDWTFGPNHAITGLVIGTTAHVGDWKHPNDCHFAGWLSLCF